MISDITSWPLGDIKNAYKNYLVTQNFSQTSISTLSSDVFYIWRKSGAETFWNVVLSDDFEKYGRSVLLDLFRVYSRGNYENNVNQYMAPLRYFRQFLLDNSSSNISIVKKAEVKQASIPTERSSLNLPRPSKEQVEHYLAKWKSSDDYHLQEDALDRLFFTLSPKNTNLSDILLKVSVLNDIYSTNIYKKLPVAKHILALNIDSRLQNGDVTLVDDIKTVTINGSTRNFYSFATKYCSHHNPLAYPIYDSYVDEVLRYYRDVNQFSTFQNSKLKEYSSFIKILDEFRSYYHLENYNFKDLDEYLWQLGKEYFNKYN